MGDLLLDVEDMMHEWIISLPIEEVKEITNPGDVIASINEEAEEEMKNRLWELVKYEINFFSLIERLQNYTNNIKKVEDSETESEEENSDEE
jgi:hypothetical protein